MDDNTLGRVFADHGATVTTMYLMGLMSDNVAEGTRQFGLIAQNRNEIQGLVQLALSLGMKAALDHPEKARELVEGISRHTAFDLFAETERYNQEKANL